MQIYKLYILLAPENVSLFEDTLSYSTTRLKYIHKRKSRKDC